MSKYISLRAPRSFVEQIVATFFFLCASVSIATTIGILAVLLFETISFFQEVSFAQFLGDTQWTPLFAEKHFGIWPLLSGTILVTIIAITVAVPLGLLGAIYLSEFATDRSRKLLKPILEVLAGIPTVVYGYFALNAVTPALEAIFPSIEAFNALSPGILMGIMILPIVASLSEDALYAVPRSLKEGAYALGATRVATIIKVQLPTAASGIAAAVILGLSRAIGETMIVAIAAGQRARLTLDPRGPIETMTAYIVRVSQGDTPMGTIEHRTIFVVGMSLFVLTLSLNIVSFRLRKRLLKGGAL